LVQAASSLANDACVDSKCSIAKNCRCSNGASPFTGKLTDWPQLVSLTFDDAITKDLYDTYLDPLLFNYKNPDKKPIGATFFVPHEYTNYQIVNNLYNYGFEIGVNSITKNPLQKYWRTATVDQLVQEFSGQKHIINKFASIPEEQIMGVRTPELQLAGDNSIDAFIKAKLLYDSSWPSLPSTRLFPYTLDFASTQECLLGAKCPNSSFPGFWVLPINELTGADGEGCNVIKGCNVEGTAQQISEWLVKEVDDIAKTSRAPLTLMLSKSWFNSTANSEEGFLQFMNTMTSRKDVFFVTQRQALNYMKNPVKLAAFKTETMPPAANCDPKKCSLKNGKESVTFYICTSCPNQYPWLGNPDGN
ncbi:unnamed protein product, partial [Phyllotreta striolata]